MTSVATDAADDVRSVVLFLGAVVLSMAYLAAVLASLVLVIAERSIESGKFAKLVTLELILALGD